MLVTLSHKTTEKCVYGVIGQATILKELEIIKSKGIEVFPN
jgi:hypothetical protein